MNILNLKKNVLYVGRASTGIWLILKERLKPGDKVLVPCNICYAAVYPIIYAGCVPIFCDVSKEDGNVSYNDIVAVKEDITAAILPHMYGNPIKEIDMIAKYFNEKGILFIEDCASAMGASIDGKLCGQWGEYSIFSTGYSKTIDIGAGGLILSNNPMAEMEKNYKKLPPKSLQNQADCEFFSKLYRLIRNSKNQQIDRYVWAGLRENVQSLFVFYDASIEKAVKNSLDILPEIIEKRRKCYRLYQENMKETNYLSFLDFDDGAVPWRFCGFVDRRVRKEFIDYLLGYGVPVSDWYPVVTPIFGVENCFEKATYMEEHIINFPIPLEKKDVLNIAKRVNQFSKKIESFEDKV